MSNEKFLTYPSEIIKTKEDKEVLSVYSSMLDKFADNEVVAKIINSKGKSYNLNKLEIDNHCSFLGKEIEDSLNFIKKRQLKIFGIISVSRESFILMLTSARIKAHHCVCFEDLSTDAIATRLKIFKPDIILCRKDMEAKAYKSLELSGLNSISIKVIDLKRIQNPNNNLYKDKPKKYNINDDFFTLFTSGSTGKPKAIVHNALNYYSYANIHQNIISV